MKCKVFGLLAALMLAVTGAQATVYSLIFNGNSWHNVNGTLIVDNGLNARGTHNITGFSGTVESLGGGYGIGMESISGLFPNPSQPYESVYGANGMYYNNELPLTIGYGGVAFATPNGVWEFYKFGSDSYGLLAELTSPTNGDHAYVNETGTLTITELTTVGTVPEPASFALMAVSLSLLGFTRKQRS